jgi:phosphatidylserine decarboxylase
LKKPFSGWQEGLRFYAPPFVLGLALLVLGGGNPLAGLAGSLLLVVAFAVAAFFRDFPRTITAAPQELVSPADGTVVAVEELDDSPHYNGPCIRISIFLSVFNAHLNRAPWDGTVVDVRYLPGKYLDARNPESSKVNESNAVWLDTPKGPMTVRQISGAVARRIVCPVKAGETLAKGEKFGMIRFGSRTELYLPRTAQVSVAPGLAVRAGLSVLARFEDTP